jgi:hypothetical protein
MDEPWANACVPMMAHKSAACLETREQHQDVNHPVPVDIPVAVAPWIGSGLRVALVAPSAPPASTRSAP